MNHEHAVNDDPPPASADYQRGIADALTAINAYLPAVLNAMQSTPPPAKMMRTVACWPRADVARLDFQSGCQSSLTLVAQKINALLKEHHQ